MSFDFDTLFKRTAAQDGALTGQYAPAAGGGNPFDAMFAPKNTNYSAENPPASATPPYVPPFELFQPSAPAAFAADTSGGFLGLGNVRIGGPVGNVGRGLYDAAQSVVTGLVQPFVSAIKDPGAYLSAPSNGFKYDYAGDPTKPYVGPDGQRYADIPNGSLAGQAIQNAEGMFGSVGGAALPAGMPAAALGRRGSIGLADLRPASDINAIRDVTPSNLLAPREQLALPAPIPTVSAVREGAGWFGDRTAGRPLYDAPMPMEGAIAQPSSRGSFWGAQDKTIAPIEGQFRELPPTEPAPALPAQLTPGRKYTFADLEQRAGVQPGEPLFAPGERPMGVTRPIDEAAIQAKNADVRFADTGAAQQAATRAFADEAAARGAQAAPTSLSDQLAASLRARGRPDLIVSDGPFTRPMSEYVANKPELAARHVAIDDAIHAIQTGDEVGAETALRRLKDLGGSLTHAADEMRRAGVLTGPVTKSRLTLEDMKPISGGADLSRSEAAIIRQARAQARFGQPAADIGASFDRMVGPPEPRAAAATVSRQAVWQQGLGEGMGQGLKGSAAQKYADDYLLSKTGQTGLLGSARRGADVTPPPQANPGRVVPMGGERPAGAQITVDALRPKGGLFQGGRPRLTMAHLTDLINIPRTLMTTGDISYSLRQGLVLSAGHPVRAAREFANQLHAFASPKFAADYAQHMAADPAYPVLKNLGLTLTDATGSLGPLEEGFLSKTIGNAPVVGGVVQASNRAGVTFLNGLRFNVAKDALRAAEIANPRMMTTQRESQLRSLMEFINAASGRSELPRWLEAHGDALNGLFFSPRFILSRIDVATALPRAAITRNPLLAKEAARDIAALAVGGWGVMQLAKLNGATVVTEPTSTDWGKIQVGNTRIDIWGGFQQEARFLAQMIEGKRTTISGQTILLDNSYKGPGDKNRLDVAMRFMRGKLGPVPGAGVDVLAGENVIGQPTTVSGEAGKLITPLAYQDIYDAITDELKGGGNGARGFGLGALSLVGVGAQTIPGSNLNTPTIPEALIGAAGGQPFFRESSSGPGKTAGPIRTTAPAKAPTTAPYYRTPRPVATR